MIIAWLKNKSITAMTLVAWVFAAAVFMIATLCILWSFTGKDVLQFNKEPIPVKPKFVKSEQEITLDVDFCKLVDTPGKVVRTIESDKTRLGAGPIVTDYQPAGCYEYELKIPIPPQTPPGVYKVKYVVVYETNPLTTVTEEIVSEPFEVIE